MATKITKSTESVLKISTPSYYTDLKILTPSSYSTLTATEPSYLSSTNSGTTIKLENVPPLETPLKYSPAYFIRSTSNYTANDLASFLQSKITSDVTSTHDSSYFSVISNLVNTSTVSDIFLTSTDFNRSFNNYATTVGYSVAYFNKEVKDSTDTLSIQNAKVLKTATSGMSTFDTYYTITNFNRVLLNYVKATDDVLGDANLDDDQYAFFTKVVKSQTATQDYLSLLTLYNRTITSQTSGSSDYLISFVGKGAKDVTYISDSIKILQVDKNLISTFSINEQLSANTNKQFFNAYTTQQEIAFISTKALLDTANTTDTIISKSTFYREYLDFVYATDDVLGSANIDDDQTAQVVKVLAEYAHLSDSIAYRSEVLREFLSPILASSSSAIDVNKIFSSTTGGTDDSLLFISLNKQNADSVTTADTITTLVEYLPRYFDLLTGVVDTKSSVVTKNIASAVSAVDLGITTLIYTTKNISDPASTLDTSYVTTIKNYLDTATTQSTLYYLLNSSYISNISTIEAVTKQVTAYRTLEDNTLVLDPAALTVQKPVLGDNTQHSEIQAFEIKPNKIDYAITGETIAANNQNYFEPGYVHPGYVGTDYTL